MKRTALILLVCALLSACGQHSVPRPYGYYRITTPEPTYRDTTYGPYGFALSNNAVLREHHEAGEKWWMDLYYPQLDATLHCSYKPVEKNLGLLTKDALEFVYKHAGQATAIPEREYANPEADVYGVLFTLQGNTASPYQFFLTDSTSHFFRGALYCNCAPNADSLQPVFDYLQTDILHLIETFRWTSR